MPEKKELNPQIASLKVGTRNLRTIKIYPAAFGDQLELTDLITKTVQEFINSKEEIEKKIDIEVVQFLLDLVKDNLARIIQIVSDEDGKLLKETTNSQVVELAELIYEMNYTGPAKNVKSLFEKILPLFQLKGQLPQSVKDTHTN